MTDQFRLDDDLISTLLRRRSLRAEPMGLEAETRDAIASTAQGNPAGAWARWRPVASISYAVVTAAAAVLLVAVVLLGITGRPVPGPGEPPASSPDAASPIPTPTQPPSWALTPVAPGTHTAGTFWPPLTFTVPDGWLSEAGSDAFFGLQPAGSQTLDFVDVFRNLSIATDDCEEAADPDVGSTATDLIGALATRPGLAASPPVAVTIGGLSGQQIDFSLAADWEGTCPQVDGPAVPLVYAQDFLWWVAQPGERFRIAALDVAGLPEGMSATVMVFVYAGDAAAWESLLDAAMPVIESFEFDTTPPAP